MDIQNISVPEIYDSSADFRFFKKWFENCLSRIQFDTENFMDLYDPLKCPENLLWMLADTMGYKFDDRLPTSFNRLVLLYFMSQINLRGSQDGVTLSAQVNLAQFNILQQAEGYLSRPWVEYHPADDEHPNGWTETHSAEMVEGKPILFNRLEDTSIPSNSVKVIPYIELGYIDVVYFADAAPLDACIEYTRPLGMFLFQHAGVRFNARTKLVLDARLTDEREINISIGPTHVGHYSREDYARLQRTLGSNPNGNNFAPSDPSHTRQPVWYRNSTYEDYKLGTTDPSGNPVYGSGAGKFEAKGRDGELHTIDPGQRALYSLQMSNNAHVVRSLLPPIFDLGYYPNETTVDVEYTDSSVPQYNLRLKRDREESLKAMSLGKTSSAEINPDVYTADSLTRDGHDSTTTRPFPAVNPIMTKMGDAMSLNDTNTLYSYNGTTNPNPPPIPSPHQSDSE